jgi:inner membrane transporter RhtA
MQLDAVPSSRTLPIGLLAVAMVSVQVGATAAKGLFPAVGAEGAATLRLLIFSPIMLAVWRPWRRRPSLPSLAPVLAYGLTLGAMNLTFYLSLRTIPLGVAVALEFVGPLAVAVLHSRRWSDLVWVGLAAVGLLLLLPLQGLSKPLEPVGMGLALVAGGLWGLYIIFGQRAGAQHGGAAVAMGGVVAALLVTPFGVAHAGRALLNPAIWPTALTAAVMSSVIPYSCEMFSLTRLAARTFGILMSLEPAIAALAGFVVLHERLAPLQVLAIAAVILASLGAVATTPAQTVDSEPPPLV